MSLNYFEILLFVVFIGATSFIFGILAYKNGVITRFISFIRRILKNKQVTIQKNTLPESAFKTLGFNWKDYNYAYQFDEIIDLYENEIVLKKAKSKRGIFKEEIPNKRHQFLEYIGLPENLGSSNYSITNEEIELDTIRYLIKRIKLKHSDKPLSIEALIGIPKTQNKQHPAMVAIHGNTSSPEKVMGLGNEDYSKSFGRTLMERGYVVVAPFILNHGEITSNIAALGSLIGEKIIKIEIEKIVNCIDLLIEQSNVDAKRIGIYGISGGGTLALYTSALDQRISCAICSGIFRDQVETFVDYALGRGLYKRSDYNFRSVYYFMPPEFYLKFSFTEVAKLVFPTPLLFENGEKDSFLSEYDDSKEFKKVKKYYTELNESGKICFHNHEGAHEISGNKSFKWLDKWLLDNDA